MADREKKLLQCIKTHDDTVWTVCAAVWDLIRAQDPEEGERYFVTFLNGIYAEDICTKDMNAFLPDEVIVLVRERLGDIGKRILMNLVKKRLPEEEFYKCLWDKLCDTALLPDRETQIAFLAYVWVDTCIPYYQIGEGCTMEEEEFARRKAQIWPVLKKAFFILSFPHEQKTQLTSLFMELAEGLQDERDRAIYWAWVLKKIQDLAGMK